MQAWKTDFKPNAVMINDDENDNYVVIPVNGNIKAIFSLRTRLSCYEKNSNKKKKVETPRAKLLDHFFNLMSQ